MKIFEKIRDELKYRLMLAGTFVSKKSEYSSSAITPVDPVDRTDLHNQLPDRRYGPDYRLESNEPVETVYSSPPVAGSEPTSLAEIPKRTESESRLIQEIKPKELDLFG